jgi:hypothetical protein
LFAHGRWFSLGTPASSTTKTGRHDIAEILLKVELKHQNQNQNYFKLYRPQTAREFNRFLIYPTQLLIVFTNGVGFSFLYLKNSILIYI